MVKHFSRYFATLPERSVRALAAVSGGTIREATEIVLPAVVRESRLYQSTVGRLVRIVVELVGDVRGVYPPELMPAGELAIRKSAGNVMEFAGLVAVGWSPLWLLAATSDLIGGSKAYLQALVAELEAERVLPPNTDVTSYDDLLSRLETASGTLADTIDIPPLTLEDARATIDRLRRQGENLPGPETLGGIFGSLQAAAEREGRSPAELSAVIGLAAARTGLQLGNTHIFEYYQEAFAEIGREGLLRYLQRVAGPYVRRAGSHFVPAAPTYTGRFLDWVGTRLHDRGNPEETRTTPVTSLAAGRDEIAGGDGDRA